VRRALLSVSIALALTSACHAGKRAESPAPPPAKTEDRPRLTDIDALEHDLAVAEQRLNAQLQKKLASREDGGGAGEDKLDDLEREPGKKSRSQAEASGSGSERRPGRRKAAGWRDRARSPCDVACRSLAS
jgi:hypothetical protein